EALESDAIRAGLLACGKAERLKSVAGLGDLLDASNLLDADVERFREFLRIRFSHLLGDAAFDVNDGRFAHAHLASKLGLRIVHRFSQIANHSAGDGNEL